MQSDTGYANWPARTLNQCMWNGLYPPKPHLINTEIGCIPASSWLQLLSCSIPGTGFQPQLHIPFAAGNGEQIPSGALHSPALMGQEQ